MSRHFEAHRPVLMGTSWMITADHPLAARVGAAVLESGGNAVDAAVAANAVLTVVRPHMCSTGGDLFALVHSEQKNVFEALNASGRAPAAANIDFYRSRGLSAIPESGILTVTVPGVLAGWRDLLERHGSMGLDTLLAGAIEYAANGFPIYDELTRTIEARQHLLAKSETAAAIFLPGGRAPRPGTLLAQPDLARALRLLADQGPDAFYRGQMGAALLDLCEATGGLISEQDLAGHTSTWVEPLRTGYRGYEICAQPPNSQGIALLMQADILESFDLAKLGPDTAETVHLMVEAKKLAFADRNQYVCDPEFHPVPIDRLLSKERAGEQAARIDRKAAARSVSPRDFTLGGNDTIYLAVVDAEGTAISLIQSIYEAFGSCVMVPGTGMILQNRGRGFTLDPDHVNRLEPGKRPYHTLQPAMILKQGRPHVVLGSPGADGQTQTVMQLATDLIDHGANVQEAVEAPRWRSNPDGGLIIEGRFPPETVAALKQLGHDTEALPDWDEVMGSAQAILIDRDNGVLQGGADPRRQAYAIGR